MMKILIKRVIKNIQWPCKSFSIYWHGYGGLTKLYRSIYLWISLLISFLILCTNMFFSTPWDWYNNVISIIPSILGFSLGGYAFIIGFGNDKFLDILRKKKSNNDISLYIKVNTSFFHFIFIQFMSIITTIIFKSLHLTGIFIFDFIGIFLFIYSLLTILSTSFAVLTLADWFDTMSNME